MIKWHPYPKEKPPKRIKNYLVTYNRNGHHTMYVDTYRKRDACRDYEGNVIYEGGWRFWTNPTAWTELPEPYTRKR